MHALGRIGPWPAQDRSREFLPRSNPRSHHSPETYIRVLSIDFGVLVGEDNMKSMKTVHPIPGHALCVKLETASGKLVVHFALPASTNSLHEKREFKIVIDVQQMNSVLHRKLDQGCRSLVLPLTLPPQYFYKDETIRATATSDPRHSSCRDVWFRATDVAKDIQAGLRYPISLHNEIADPEHIDIGRWTTFRFGLAETTTDETLLIDQIIQALEDFNIACKDSPNLSVSFGGATPMIWARLAHRTPISNASGGALALLESASKVIHLEFAVRYQLEVCISRGKLNEHVISEDFLARLAGMDPVRARLRLEFLADQDEPLQSSMSLFTNPEAEAHHSNLRLPHYCILMRKAIITPTTIRFNTPSPETSNRVVRKYNLLHDRFLRIQFMEESEKSRIGISKPQNDAIYTRLLRTMYQGIQIGDRHYEFLAFGSSQLRECGAYFFCPTENTSCDDIRKWMGQFDHIRVVAKYAARLGQCFSTTREIKGICAPQIHEIPDIERNGYCFSDGVGIISQFLGQIIVEEMVCDISEEPSAFQFRMGGCKGVLTVWPQLARGMEVHIRKSQEKFKADFNGLEIIRCARMATATLNRQTITILESLGVPKTAFQDLLDHQLRQFEKALKDSAMAIELLTRFVDENQVTLVIADLIRAKFVGDSLREPFVTTVLNLWRSWSVKLLKEKARIQVEQSAFVLGCVDETGSLRGHDAATEGSTNMDEDKLPEIFLQISDPKTYKKATVIEDVCIVGRNPSLHPGDIRVVRAVDKPELHHLRDVVVFPSTGDKPLPNMLSGGDLDGDDFFVIWDKTLIPPEWNHRPMDYSGSKPRELDRAVNVDDLRNFFVSYIKNDVLPLVAVSHLGCANESPQGPKSSKCLRLAALHSEAVDFPKTGEPVAWDPREQPRKWPHFMEKRNSYKSNKALGQIYDRVCSHKSEFRPDWEDDFDQRILKSFDFDNEKLKAARKIKTQYDTAVRRILTQQNVATEFELWTGFAMSKPAVGSDYKRQEYLGREYDTLKQRFREMCYEAAGGHGRDKIDPFVAAMYKVTEEQIKIALFEHNRGLLNKGGELVRARKLEARSMPLVTFPWIFHWVLIRIAQSRSR